MKPIQGYTLIKPDDLHWRPSNLMRIPNADFLERTGSFFDYDGKMNRICAKTIRAIC
jgi:hypothetical protein